MKIFLIIIALFIIVDVIIILYVVASRMRRKIAEKDIKAIQKNWKSIISGKDMKHAIMDADKLLDHALYLQGLRGNMGAKLKKSTSLFKNINKIWSAHKVRNNIAHQINYQVGQKTYRSCMLAFKQAFQDLKIFK